MNENHNSNLAGTPKSGSDNSKLFGILGYIFPILFFLPLIMDTKHNTSARFHANQQLMLLIWYGIANVILIIPILGWIIQPIMVVIGIILAIMGVMNVANGTMKRLPIIGKYELLK